MAIVVSRQTKADTSLSTSRCQCPLESGRDSLESSRLGIMNSVNLE